MSIFLAFIPAAVLLFVLAFLARYFTRLKSIGTIRKHTDCADGYDLYQVEIKYDYRLDKLLQREYSGNQQVTDAVLSAALPLLPIHMELPDYSCSAFSLTDVEGDVLMGRNYDFDIDTSALIVCCAPKNGYRSVGTVALDNVSVRKIKGVVSKLSTMPGPMICLDGMNEKGVSIAVLMLDSAPVRQQTGKPGLFTTLAIRLVLDWAATTQEAVDLLRGCDMFAVSGGDYQFYVTDAAGDGRVIEYDCESASRELVDIPVRSATNFYELYKDKVLPNQHNGIYGHGRERYDRMEALFAANEGSFTVQTAWDALQAASQLPNPGEPTSNTQWSIVYNNTQGTAEYTLRRNWGEITSFRLADFSITGKTH